MIRVAAVGDLHVGADAAGTLRPHLERLPQLADVLLVAGDLTRRGLPDEADVVADELASVMDEVPVVAVFGNHDCHSDLQEDLSRRFIERGIHHLEGSTWSAEIGGETLAVVGLKGFGGGFWGACGSDFGEREMRVFIQHTAERAQVLREQLAQVEADHCVVLMHYAPIPDTLRGERPEIYPFLGSYLFAEVIDEAGCVDLVLHGHAHAGQHKGVTPGGVHVRNVAQPVLGATYTLFQLGGSEQQDQDARVIDLGVHA